MANLTGRKFWRWAAAAVALILVAGLIGGYVAARPYGVTGTTYIAKQLCSCVFLTGRSDASCQGDFKPDIDKFTLRIDHASRSVSARLLLFSSEAVYDVGTGCRIVR